MPTIKKKNKDWELTDLESFVKDVFDPVQFLEAMFYVMYPDEIEPQPLEVYSYQKEWVYDDSLQKAAAKSRQIGFSYIEMLGVSLHKAITTPNKLKMVMSLDHPKSKELLKIVKEAVGLMNKQFQIPMKISRESIEFDNGSRIIALPNVASATRSYHGDIFIDEIAFMPNDKDILDAVLGSTVRGYGVSIGSTPFGQRGEYHNIMQQTGWDTTSVWLDEAEILDFTRQYLKTRQENPTEWSLHVIPWFMCPDLERHKLRANTQDGLLQEYAIAFLDETTAMLPYSLLLNRAIPNVVQIDPNNPQKFKKKGRLVFGLDPAEKINQTALVAFELIDGVWVKRLRKVWQGENHKVYVPQIVDILKGVEFDHLYIDATGIGYSVYLELMEYLHSYKVTEVQFTNPKKEEMVHTLVSLYEADIRPDEDPTHSLNSMMKRYKILTDVDQMYFDQLHQLRRDTTEYGKPRYSGKIEGKDDDIIWAAGLALTESTQLKFGRGRVSSIEVNKERRRF